MLQIRLSKPSNEGSGNARPSSADNVMVACPDHLIIADLPVAKSLGSANANSVPKIVGRKSRRQLGERVHFCVQCDHPIAIYGRLIPCGHVFCLDCSRNNSLCYLCDERVQKIQTIKLMEGIYICAAPHCLKSFLEKSEFRLHIYENHPDLLPNGNESEAVSARKPSASDSTVQGTQKPLFSPTSNPPPPLDYRNQPPKPMMQSRPMIQNTPSEQQGDSNPFGSQNRFPLQTFDSHSGQVPDRQQQQGILSEPQFTEYPMQYPQQPPNFAVPMNSNPGLIPSQFGYPPFAAPDGALPFYGAAPYEMTRSDSTSDMRSEQGSLLGFPPGYNFAEGYSQPWNMGPTAASPAGQGPVDGSYMNASDTQGRASFPQGDYGRNPGMVPNLTPSPNHGHSGNSMDPRDGKGILAPQPQSLPPPPPKPHN